MILNQRMWLFLCLAIVGLFFIQTECLALMPPMELKELEQDSNLIVEGKVVKVYSVGPVEENKCSRNTPHDAVLNILKTHKGTEFKAVVIHFEKTEFKDGCVGSPDHVHHVGESGTFYLSCQLDSCRLTHWNGVKNENSVF